MERIKLFVACHKPFDMPVNDLGFQPIHVGSEESNITIKGAIKDNTGDNISKKNSIYCELTGLYWIWKNYNNSEYIGLCHYRRFFADNAYCINYDKSILSSSKLLEEIKNYDIILPCTSKKNKNNHYYTNNSDYESDRVYIEITSAIKDLYPEYLNTAIDVLKNKRMSFGNIFIANKTIFSKYCDWLFQIEFYLENFIVENFGEIEPREMGFISEWLLNIWVQYNKLKIKYIPVCTIYNDNKFIRLMKQLRHLL